MWTFFPFLYLRKSVSQICAQSETKRKKYQINTIILFIFMRNFFFLIRMIKSEATEKLTIQGLILKNVSFALYSITIISIGLATDLKNKLNRHSLRSNKLRQLHLDLLKKYTNQCFVHWYILNYRRTKPYKFKSFLKYITSMKIKQFYFSKLSLNHYKISILVVSTSAARLQRELLNC